MEDEFCFDVIKYNEYVVDLLPIIRFLLLGKVKHFNIRPTTLMKTLYRRQRFAE